MTGRSIRDDAEYFRARALQEQVAANNARSVEARKCHDALAMVYRFKAAMLSSGPDSWEETVADAQQPETV